MSSAIKIISSMATRQLLADLVATLPQAPGQAVLVESVGGVDAARRVRADEAFDGVVLAADVIDKLIAEGKLLPARIDLVRSGVAIAVREGAPAPDISSEDAVRAAVLAARTIGFSTGPSGAHLARLFERWGIAEQVQARIVTAPPGVPVGTLVAKGDVELGFQQLSEMMNLPGIAVLGPLPPAIQIITTFSAGVAATSTQPERVRELFTLFASPATAAIKRENGMDAV